MRLHSKRHLGFTLIELMLSITIGLLIIAAVIGLYMAQKQIYNSSNSQAAIQNSDNAISGLVVPIVRSAGFAGCGSLVGSTSDVLTALNPGAPYPLGNLANVVTFIKGYEANNTGSAGTLAIAPLDPVNDVTATDWTPTLDSTLVGDVEKGSDVIVLLGPVAGTVPTGTTAATTGVSTIAVQSGAGFVAGQVAAISDCGKSIVFGVSSVSGNTITHAIGSGGTGNTGATFGVNFTTGAQVVPLQQTALFVGQGQDGHSDLMIATYTSGAWTVSPLIPGVDTMQVLYGTGASGAVTAYVPASSVLDWTSVYTVRIGLLIEGEKQSVSGHSAAASTFTVLGNTVTVPPDGILRHVEEVTINLRNL
jgi:type IV pilus assembly protein PilW